MKLREGNVFTARKRSLGQGNIFTHVCHSDHRGGSGTPPQTRPSGTRPPTLEPDTPPGPDTPRDQTHTPQTRQPPIFFLLAYGQRTGSTHPIGMHSCLILFTEGISSLGGAIFRGAVLRGVSMMSLWIEPIPSHLLFANGRYASYWNVVLFASVSFLDLFSS